MEALLRHIHQLAIQHIDSSVRPSVVTSVSVLVLLFLHQQTLDEAAQTLRHLCDTDFSLHSTAVCALATTSITHSVYCMVQEVAFTQLMDELVQNMKSYLDACQDQSMVREGDGCVVSSYSLLRLTRDLKRPLDWLCHWTGLQPSASLSVVVCRDTSSHMSYLHRVLDLSRWNLAGQLADLLEPAVQGGLSDRVGPLLPMALPTTCLFLCPRWWVLY